MSGNAMQHVEYLSVKIGPRGSTTPQERQAAEYAHQQFQAAGLEAHLEEFRSPRTGWRPFSVAALIGLACLALFLAGGRTGALVGGLVMLVTTLSVLAEVNLLPNPLRWLMPHGPSQNVWARVPAAGSVRRRVLLVGHIDTHRTPWAFTTPQRLAFFRLMTTLGTASFLLATVIFLAAAFVDFGPFRWLTLILAVVYLILLALTWQPDTTPFTHGANDNASGAGIVLSLAGRLARNPLPGIEVWALCSGCEEVGTHGTQAFLKRHKREMGGVVGINIDNVGGQGAGVCYITSEGLLVPFKPDAELLRLAQTVQAEHADWKVHSTPFNTMVTDGTCLMIYGVPALSFVGLRPDGTMPNWHQVSDTFENIDPASVENTEAFVLALLQRLG